MHETGCFPDQVVIVTGASAGIGRFLVIQLSDRGAKVSIAVPQTERLLVINPVLEPIAKRSKAGKIEV